MIKALNRAIPGNCSAIHEDCERVDGASAYAVQQIYTQRLLRTRSQ